MIKVNVEIDDEVMEYTLPDNWDEVTIGDFIKLFSFEREGLNSVELSVKIINVLTDIDEDLIMMMNVSDFERLAEVFSFTAKDLKPTNVSSIELEGETYYLKNDFSKLTMGEIISIETLLQSADGNLFKVMDKLLCIFLRKKKENGKLEAFKGEFMDRTELFRNAPITKVYNVFSFFLTGGTTLEDNTKDYLENPPN
jgi:hypothetical protein